jgi:hypothetical protein
MKSPFATRTRAFLKAYLLLYVSLYGLTVLIDAFANLDEFCRRADTSLELFRIMGRYYLADFALPFFRQFGGVIGVLAAIHAVIPIARVDGPTRDRGVGRPRPEPVGDMFRHLPGPAVGDGDGP